MNRRDCLISLQSLGMLTLDEMRLFGDESDLLKRAIPVSGELLPGVGMGTWRTFDVETISTAKEPLKKVLTNLHQKGGKVIDSSPMYGRSEAVAGELSTVLNLNDKFFIATKVWTSGKDEGIRQMNESFKLLRRDRIDLMQVHNLVDWQTHIKTLRAWKEEGKIRYIGITHYLDSIHDTMAQIIDKEKIDFIQVNYNLSDRHAENKLLPLAQEKGVGVIINRPFQEGVLFFDDKGKKTPGMGSRV